MPKMFRGLTTVLALAGMAFLTQTSRAADYPTRNITLVVPYPPGGGVVRGHGHMSVPVKSGP